MILLPVWELPLDLCVAGSSLTTNQNLINLLMCFFGCFDTVHFFQVWALFFP